MKKVSVILVIILSAMQIASAQSSKVTTATTHLSNGDLDKAKDAIDIALTNEKTMGEAKTWYYKGRIYGAIGMDESGKYRTLCPSGMDTALNAFKTALNLPDVKSFKSDIFIQLQFLQLGFFNKGATAYSNKDYETAYSEFTKSSVANNLQFDIDPSKAAIDTGAIFNSGLCAEKIGKIDEAIGTYQKLVNMKYTEPFVYQELAELYISKGNMDLAKSVIEAGRTQFPNEESLMLEELNFYLRQGKVTEIIDKLKAAIILDPQNAELYFALGNSYGELMKADSTNSKSYLEGAEDAYKNAIKYKTDYFDAYLNMGALFYNAAIDLNKIMIALPLDAQAQYDKLEKERNALYVQALPYFENALALDKTNPQLIQPLKEIYARTGNTEKLNEIKKLNGE